MSTPKKTIRIVAVVVDTRNLTMYKEDGTTLIIPQGDPRLRKIVESATPQLIAKKYADVVIDEEESINSYAKFEEQGNGVVKFFKVAKSKLANLFTAKEEPVVDTSPVPTLTIGPVPAVPEVGEHLYDEQSGVIVVTGNGNSTVTPEVPVDVLVVETEEGVDNDQETFEPVPVIVNTKVEQTMNAVNEILKYAIPVASEDFNEKDVAKQGDVVGENGITDQKHYDNEASPDTIVAVVDGKILPGMERIKTQFNRAAKMGSTVGVERFLQRLAGVIEQRRHSIDDLLKFMERGDLPIADDGSILIYKVLRRRGDRTDGKYVDCHSGRVEQWTGAYVCMDPSLVDHNRNNECSNGLHVARRGYIRNFSGDVCVLAKLAPEDVIAVPEYDANKMRVCGYHILMELSDIQYQLIRSNKPITEDEEGKRLLAAAIAGKHVHKTHEVRITGGMGTGIVVKRLNKTMEEQAPVLAKVEKVTALANPEVEMLDEPTEPLDVVKEVEAQKVMSRKEQAAVLYQKFVDGVDGALTELCAFKKAAKVNWDKLGITDPAVINSVSGPGATAKELPVASKTPAMPKVAPPKKKATKKARKAAAKAKAKQVTKPVPKVKTAPVVMEVEMDGSEDRRGLVYDSSAPTGIGEASPRMRIAKLLAIGLDSADIARSILDIKKKSKKSWDVLDVTPEQAATIMQKLGL